MDLSVILIFAEMSILLFNIAFYIKTKIGYVYLIQTRFREFFYLKKSLTTISPPILWIL